MNTAVDFNLIKRISKLNPRAVCTIINVCCFEVWHLC